MALILLRRWYVVVPLAAASFAFGVVKAGGIQPEYVAGAAVVITGSSELIALNPDTGELEIEEHVDSKRFADIVLS